MGFNAVFVKVTTQEKPATYSSQIFLSIFFLSVEIVVLWVVLQYFLISVRGEVHSLALTFIVKMFRVQTYTKRLRKMR